MRGVLALLAVLCLLTLPARAQDLATLVADRVEIAGDDTLLAQGAVEVFHQGTRLKASRILYDRASDSLQISGPIVLTEASGNTIILADQALLSSDLTNGVLQSARLVLNQQLQLAAAEMQRVAGRYTALGNTVASSCKVCANNPTPLWEIRARRVIHDQQERQIYFESAQFRVAGVPIFYLPRLRMPDPTLERATGFLRPSLTTTTGLGTGIKVPYFIRINDQSDLTVTPFISTKNARTLNLRYRQAFRTGRIEVNGALSRDQLRPGETRGYAALSGAFTLARDFNLTFSTEMVTDPAYLLDYGISGKDRLDSRAEITRTRRNEYISGRLIYFNSIRSNEANASLPSIISDFTWQRRFSPGGIGGEGGLRFQTHSHYRSSNLVSDSDGDGISDGRDMSRLSINADWRRNWVLPRGILASALTEVSADAFTIRQDSKYQGNITRLYGGAGVELRWPWVRHGKGGVSHIVEPVVQLIWSRDTNYGVPNEDSVLVEFDEGNLYSFNRYPGSDAVEQGARANVGLGYTRYDPAGWSLGVSVGRVLRAKDLGQFGIASGLKGSSSDWLAAIRFSMADGVKLTNRLVFGNDFQVTKGEMRFDLEKTDYSLASSYIWMLPDATESRTARVSELSLNGSYKFTPAWEGGFSTRYDFVADRAGSAGLSLAFRNECLKVDMSVSRRFTSSADVDPSTNFGLSVDLLGFGGRALPGPSRQCSG